MHAAGHGVVAFFRWAFDRVDWLADEMSFDWNAINDANRNVVNLCGQQSVNPAVGNMLKNLVGRKYVKVLQHAVVPGQPYRQGGASRSHSRHRRNAIVAPDDRSEWKQDKEDSDKWHHSD